MPSETQVTAVYKKRGEAKGPEWHIAMQPGSREFLSDSAWDND